MDAVGRGAKQGESFRHTSLFEKVTREEYRKLGRVTEQSRKER
jgi:hypothetical protein